MKKLLFSCMVSIAVICACTKSSDNSNNNDNSIQKQIVNTKWYYDSTVFWHKGDGYSTSQDYSTKTYLYFDNDSVMTEFNWTGPVDGYEQTRYAYSWNDDILVCDYDFINDFHSIQIKNNQLIFADIPTSPQQTDT